MASEVAPPALEPVDLETVPMETVPMETAGAEMAPMETVPMGTQPGLPQPPAKAAVGPLQPLPNESAEVTPVKPLRVKELSGVVISPVSGAGSPSPRSNSAFSTRLSFPGERSFSAAKSDEISSSDEDDEGELNACDLTTTDAQLERLLQSSAVELCLEVRGIGRGTIYGVKPIFVALFLPGAVRGTWSELDRTENVIDTRAVNRFVKKIRVPAATPQDREEEVCLAIFDVDAPEKLEVDLALAACKISLDELLAAPMMSMQMELSNPKTGRRKKGNMEVAADLVPHAEKEEILNFDFGFSEDAPNRNRMMFILSRSTPRGLWSPVYRSEVRTREDLEAFNTVSLTSRELNAGNDRRLLRLEVYRYYKNLTCTLLGFCQTSLLSLRTCPVNAGIYWWPAQDGISNAKLVLENRNADDDQSTFVLRVHDSSFKINP